MNTTYALHSDVIYFRIPRYKLRNSRLQHEVGPLGSYKLCRVDCKLTLFGSLTFFLKPSMVIYLCIFISMSLKGINTYVINLIFNLKVELSTMHISLLRAFRKNMKYDPII